MAQVGPDGSLRRGLENGPPVRGLARHAAFVASVERYLACHGRRSDPPKRRQLASI
jgi:hypothetical protein